MRERSGGRSWEGGELRWQREEEAVIEEEMAKGKGWCQRVHQRLPHRTMGAIDCHAAYTGITVHHIRPYHNGQERGRLRPGQASIARSQRRQTMQRPRRE